MTYPTNGSHVAGPITLSWDPVVGAEEYRYKLALSPEFVGASWVTVPTASALVSLGVGAYFWKVQQRTGEDWSDDSDVLSFVHDAPPTPVLVSPAEGIAQYGFVTFVWSPVVEAVKYMILWSTTEGFELPYTAEIDAPVIPIEETTPTVSYSPGSRFLGGKDSSVTWYWKVKASDGVNWSDDNE